MRMYVCLDRWLARKLVSYANSLIITNEGIQNACLIEGIIWQHIMWSNSKYKFGQLHEWKQSLYK